jgi:hypothetical protein
MPLASKTFLAILLLLCSGFAVWFIPHELRTPQNESEVMDRQIEPVRAGRYDTASQVIETWMKDSRRDVSHDGMLYQQIAIAYFGKAWSRPTGKRESIRRADLNLERALDLYNRENAAGLRVDLFEIGRGHEQLGDLSNRDKCLYDRKAAEGLTRQLLLVKGDSYEADGKKFPPEPLRKDINQQLDAVREKSADTRCANTDKNG